MEPTTVARLEELADEILARAEELRQLVADEAEDDSG